MKINCAYTELVELHKLQPNPKNPNKHPDKQIEMLAKIIDYQGQRAPIVVSKRSGFITKGHGRLMAITKLGWAQCAVDYQDYESEAQEYADMVADNKIAELAEHDDNFMIDTIKELEMTEFDFTLMGIENLSLTDGDWNDGADGVDNIEENLDGISAVIKVKCPQAIKDEVLIIVKRAFLETSLEGVEVV